MQASGYFNELIQAIKQKRLSKDALSRLKLRLCRKYGLKHIPTDIEVLLNASVSDINIIKKYLRTKPTRSLSGVAVVAVMTRPYRCPHGRCITCPGGPGSEFGTVPQSYTGKEPATRRAIRNSYDPYLQIFNRLEQYIASGHSVDKVELIIMGGTFIARPRRYRDRFVMLCYRAMNDFSRIFYKNGVLDIIKFREFFELPGDIEEKGRMRRIKKRVRAMKSSGAKKSLEYEQRKNEVAAVRCVGLTIETRSDYGKLKQGSEMLRLGCTRVEVGVQSVYDSALRMMERGHTTKDNIESIRILKDLGFKINVHYMPGLFVSKKKDLAGMKQLFSDPDYRPDMLKIYPCMVLKGTRLYDMWKKGRYRPLGTRQAAEIISRFKESVPEYCRIMRVQRDIPTYATSAGVDRTNLRQYIQEIMKKNGTRCRCIRCREIGRSGKPLGHIKIEEMQYEASKGDEFFISAVSGDNIAGFCRLRFPSMYLRKEIGAKSALLRELHVYGLAMGIGRKGPVQHRGLGRKLLLKAEKIALANDKNKMVVISGIGAREYYRRHGYRREGPYMVKRI